jgi:hypothetical protein
MCLLHAHFLINLKYARKMTSMQFGELKWEGYSGNEGK